MRIWLTWVFVWISSGLVASAHVGSPTVFFEGKAGAYPLRVVVRPPEVIPGLADVWVRLPTNGVRHVSALPIRWNTGRQGAPPPDEAILVRGETNLFAVQLWFMQGGAQSVEVEISGEAGTGRVIVPVNAVATRVLGMSPGLRTLLSLLGIGLFVLMASIVGAAIREACLPYGATPSRGRRWFARGATVAALLTLGALLWFGRSWWQSEANAYRNNRLYRPLKMNVDLNWVEGHGTLRLGMLDVDAQRGAPLVPDHGKLMHLFLMREPGMDIFAHLHPQKLDWKTFETPLPNLPAGGYSLYADITYETGFADTLAARLTIDPPFKSDPPEFSLAMVDSDNAFCMTAPFDERTQTQITAQPTLGTNNPNVLIDLATDGPWIKDRETTLRFRVHDPVGKPVVLEPYLGMSGHLVLRREDGSVFTHLHPGGSFSMAAQHLFELRSEGKAPLKVASATNDPICRLPNSAEIESLWRKEMSGLAPEAISFPYAFPKAGNYRLWLQIKVDGSIVTRVFDVAVQPAT